MEKVYMEAPKQARMWKPEDISPYDFKDDLPVNSSYVMDDENDDEFDMDALLDEMNSMDDEMNFKDDESRDMYENGNIDWRCNEDMSQRNCKNLSMERKTIVEEENPKRVTTTWMRVTKQY